ncbi:MAG: alpha-ribazole phosphatase [Armatimonadota bacterium]
MTILYLVRHGETAWNAGGRFQGQQDTPLSDKGCGQARSVAQALAGRHFDAVYTSDLARAAETAACIAAPHGLTPMRDIRLREVYFGEWEGLTVAEVTERWPEVIAAWRADSLRTRPPGAETLQQMLERITAFTEEMLRQYPDGELCIVAHGGSLRALLVYALGGDPALYRRLRLDNCSISIVKVTGDRWSLLLCNDTCHLGTPVELATTEAGDQWRLALKENTTTDAESGER